MRGTAYYNHVFKTVDFFIGNNRNCNTASIDDGIANDLRNAAKCFFVAENGKLGNRNAVDSKRLMRIFLLLKHLVGVIKENRFIFACLDVLDESTQSRKGSILIFAGNDKLIANNAVAVIVPP